MNIMLLNKGLEVSCGVEWLFSLKGSVRLHNDGSIWYGGIEISHPLDQIDRLS